MKPRVQYSAFLASRDAWGEAFARVKAMGEGSKLGAWTVTWIHEGPPDWVQLKLGREKRMCRRGDPLLIELTK